MGILLTYYMVYRNWIFPSLFLVLFFVHACTSKYNGKAGWSLLLLSKLANFFVGTKATITFFSKIGSIENLLTFQTEKPFLPFTAILLLLYTTRIFCLNLDYRRISWNFELWKYFEQLLYFVQGGNWLLEI